MGSMLTIALMLDDHRKMNDLPDAEYLTLQ